MPASDLHLEGDVTRRVQQTVSAGQHRVEVAPEGERTLGLDAGGQGHLDELPGGRRPETSNRPDENPGDDQRRQAGEHRDGDRQDGFAEVGKVVDEVDPPGVGVGEEVG